MYNPRLETFIRTADAGSFSKAAEQEFITPAAIIKQINLLEAEMGVQLFERTNRGVTFTDVGKSLYKDSKYIIKYCMDSMERVRNVAKRSVKSIRIGSSPITPAQFLVDLWPSIHAKCPDIRFQLIPFENTPENAREILRNLGQNIDVVAGIFDDVMLDVRQCVGLEISREPVCVAMSIHHPLAGKERLSVSDLYGEHIMLMQRGWSRQVDLLRENLWREHPQIEIVDFDFYNVEVFNRCENSPDMLMAIKKWDQVHPLLKIVPIEWGYSMPFGFLHSSEPSDEVKQFLTVVQAVMA